MKTLKIGSKQYDNFLNRDFAVKKRVSTTVSKIVNDVRDNGDQALLRYTKKFDNVKLKPRDIRVSQSEISGAYQGIDTDIVNSIKTVIDNINKFYKKTKRKSWKTKNENGVVVGERITAIDSVGVYVPSGTVPLVSSVYMSVLPAKMAGVKKIVMVSPPNKYGTIDPYILVMADLLKVDEVYKAGGAQAIAALAFGTKNIPKVNKIVGPGNEYVTEAKRQVFGFCDIDMLAGPSEVLILASHNANPDYVVKDMLAQSEHHLGISVLVTPSKRLATAVKKKVDKGYLIQTKNMDEAIDITNQIAPEHLEIIVKDQAKVLKKIRNAGAIFLGPYTPVTVGDYVAGPSHVLPTAGTARFFSGLGVDSFMKSSHLIHYTKKALDEVRPILEKLTAIEQLPRHMEAVRARFE
jgi:histidinol dehydrogenase